MISNNNKKSLLKTKAFTLVELVIVIFILPMVIFLAYSLLNHSLKTSNEQKKDVDIQYETRQAMNLVDEQVRYEP